MQVRRQAKGAFPLACRALGLLSVFLLTPAPPEMAGNAILLQLRTPSFITATRIVDQRSFHEDVNVLPDSCRARGTGDRDCVWRHEALGLDEVVHHRDVPEAGRLRCARDIGEGRRDRARTSLPVEGTDVKSYMHRHGVNRKRSRSRKWRA